MGSAEVESVELIMLKERLAELQEDERYWSEVVSRQSSTVSSLAKIRDDMMVERYLATKALASLVKQNQHMQMQACLWRGIIAVRKTSPAAVVKEKRWLKRDNAWITKRTRRTVRETLPLQRECVAFEKQTK